MLTGEEVVPWGRAVCFWFFFFYGGPSGSTQMGLFCSAWGFTGLRGEEGSGEQVWEVALTAQCGEQSP